MVTIKRGKEFCYSFFDIFYLIVGGDEEIVPAEGLLDKPLYVEFIHYHSFLHYWRMFVHNKGLAPWVERSPSHLMYHTLGLIAPLHYRCSLIVGNVILKVIDLSMKVWLQLGTR